MLCLPIPFLKTQVYWQMLLISLWETRENERKRNEYGFVMIRPGQGVYIYLVALLQHKSNHGMGANIHQSFFI